MRPRLIRPSYFAWIILLAGLWLAYSILGLPHVIWAYRYLDHGQGADPFVNRYYTSCTFVGPYGVFTRDAVAGECGWFAFFKSEGGDR
ncbi:hypothetical protein ACFQ14_12615 [Pseudahrensia aquimaris]|uniref:Uncharacterized protein n=1 Tax=Pseudahrensia aquimaris TaxID=744461 RepID=A0ABW3FK22_9HYPH